MFIYIQCIFLIINLILGRINYIIFLCNFYAHKSEVNIWQLNTLELLLKQM